MATKFIARGLNIQGGPEERDRMNGLARNAKISGDNYAKKVWGKTFIRNGYKGTFGKGRVAGKFCKTTIYTPKPTDKRVPSKHGNRRYVVYHVSYTEKILKRTA